MTHCPDMMRRRLLGLLTTAVAADALGAPALSSKIAFERDPFALGVASGSPSDSGVVLWTRLMGAPEGLDAIPVKWEVLEEGGKVRPVAGGTATARAELAHSVHVEVEGLRPGRWYRYRFMAGDAVSSWGRTRTMPAADDAGAILRFAYASCQRWEDGYFAAYRHMLADAPDLVLFVGDYIYEYAVSQAKNPVRMHTLPLARTLADYRDRYALYRSDPDLQKMHAACPWLVTMDDHDVEDNYAGRFSVNRMEGFEAKRIAAYQAFYEHMPVRADSLVRGLAGLGSTGGLRIYQRVDAGRLATFHVLDNRQYRDAPLCGPKPLPGAAAVCRKADSRGSTMLGVEQERWLDAGLRRAAQRQTRWNFLVQQTAFSPRNYGFGEGSHAGTDSWDGFPAARERLIGSLLARRPANPVFIGGDLHQNWIANVHAVPYDAKSPIVAADLCGTSISSRGVPPERARTVAAANPHCLFANSTVRGYGLVLLDGKGATVRLRGLEDVRDPASPVRDLAEFALTAGAPGVERRA